MLAVALPVAFGLGFAAGGFEGAIGAAAVSAALVFVAAAVFARRYLRAPPRPSGR
jgi:hypothetical protein